MTKRTTKTIIAAALVCTIPLGLFAYDKYEKRHDRHDNGDCNKSTYHHNNYNNMGFFDESEDEFYFDNGFFLKSGANLAFEGKVEKRPTKGFNGVWKISGMEVTVDDNTKIFLDKNFKVGEDVDVIAKRESGKIKALQIELD